jgi:hypothetical protein
MPQIANFPRAGARSPKTVTSMLTVSVAADADMTQRALRELDPFAPAIVAIRALGLADRVTSTAGGMRWHFDEGHIEIEAELRVGQDEEDGSTLTVIARFSASDERTHERLLEAWPVIGPLAASLVKRAARAIKHRAEDDRFEETIEQARAA